MELGNQQNANALDVLLDVAMGLGCDANAFNMQMDATTGPITNVWMSVEEEDDVTAFQKLSTSFQAGQIVSTRRKYTCRKYCIQGRNRWRLTVQLETQSGKGIWSTKKDTRSINGYSSKKAAVCDIARYEIWLEDPANRKKTIS